MLACLNFGILIAASMLFTGSYVKSVSPAALERTMGQRAYERCGQYRLIASVFMTVAAANYMVYYWYPLPVPLPRTFPWGWTVSALIALVIAVPSGYLMYRGIRDAGAETMEPKKEHEMYGGIYTKIRHPQALGEFPLWWAMAFLANSPFLVLFSCVYVPVWYYLCRAEERDLLLRYGEAYEAYCQRVGFWLPKRPGKEEQ